MLLVLICFGLVVPPSLGIELVFEKIELQAGFDVFESTLRVRKFNRTTTALNGTLTIKVDMNDTLMVHTDLFHSSLGNQQFNHYPMKLPTDGMCQFMQNIHDNYYDYFQRFHNFPERGECPIRPRSVHVINELFPSNKIPPTFPKGLWKVLVTTKVGNVNRTRFELVVKAYSDSFF